MRRVSTRLGVLSNSADGGRACAFGVYVRGKSTAASVVVIGANTTKTMERERESERVMEEKWIITTKVHIVHVGTIIIMLIIYYVYVPTYYE